MSRTIFPTRPCPPPASAAGQGFPRPLRGAALQGPLARRELDPPPCPAPAPTPAPTPAPVAQALGALALATAACLLPVAPAQAVSAGQPAPAVELPATRDAQDGSTTLRLEALRGQVVYLDFWASWCGPCRQSFPWMNALQQRFGARGLQVVGINVDSNGADARQFLAKVPAQFRIAFDPAGDTPRRYAIPGMPTSVLIGADGKVLRVHAGFRAEDTAALEAAIDQALGPASR